MDKKFNRSLQIAKALFDPAFPIRCFHLSFIWYKNRLVSVGQNTIKTHTHHKFNPKINTEGENVSEFKKTCSEFNSLNKIRRLTNIPFSKCTLINIRINRNGQLSNSRPCVSCDSLLNYLNIKEIFFTNNEGLFEKYLI